MVAEVRGINNVKRKKKVKKRNLHKHCKPANRSESSELKMKIFDQRGEMSKFVPDSFATSMLTMSTPDWIPSTLYFEMTDSLRGFDSEMALIIVDNLIDCMSGFGLHVTGFAHVDDLLGHLYARILTCAFKQGIHLKYPI